MAHVDLAVSKLAAGRPKDDFVRVLPRERLVDLPALHARIDSVATLDGVRKAGPHSLVDRIVA
jgi:hypothetical protein